VYVGEHADVTEATHATRGGSPIALKRLHLHTARDPGMRALFDRECALACGLPPHPAVVRGIDAGEVEGRPWLAMPLVPGEDLRALIARGASVEPAKLGAAVCAALAHLHAAGWIHGDCTPANLLVSSDGVVLCDLGVARPPDEPGPVRGTHAYMAPEQVRGEPWTPATDLWALGVVLWELAAGARLFLRDQPWLTMAAVVEHVPAPLPDPRLDALVTPLLRKAPAARPSSAAELGAALAALV
jgi:serine/threonine protein kinase